MFLLKFLSVSHTKEKQLVETTNMFTTTTSATVARGEAVG
jgi:hypothetical protein